MKEREVDIYLIHPLNLPPDEIYVNGVEISLISGHIQGVYSDMLVVEGNTFIYNKGQGWVLYDLDHMDSIIIPKSNIRSIVVKDK